MTFLSISFPICQMVLPTMQVVVRIQRDDACIALDVVSNPPNLSKIFMLVGIGVG